MTDLASELAEVVQELASPVLEARVSAVEELAHVANKIVDMVLEEFAKPGSARYLIFERLMRSSTSTQSPRRLPTMPGR
jgi:hypothetical protein